jgi:methionyl-tRNA synthetase
VLKVDLGNGDIRQIVSGIATCYTPGQVMGKSVIVVSNLQPVTIRGVESHGMLLAGKNGNQIQLAEAKNLKPGTRIS